MCGGINEALPFHPEFSWLIAPHGAPPHHFNFKWSLPTPPVLANKCCLVETRVPVGNECRHLLITTPSVRGDATLRRRKAALMTRRKSSRSKVCCSHLSAAVQTLKTEDAFFCLNEVRHLVESAVENQAPAVVHRDSVCVRPREAHRLRQGNVG